MGWGHGLNQKKKANDHKHFLFSAFQMWIQCDQAEVFAVMSSPL